MTETTTAPGPGDLRDERQEQYDDMLEHLDIVIEQSRYKLDGPGRITDASLENARANHGKTIIRAIKERREVLRSRRLEEIADEVEQLKADREQYP